MVLGTIGGAYAGHKVQQRYKDPVQGQQVVVRTTTGVLVTVTQPANPNLAVGQNVAIEGNGEDARVVPPIPACVSLPAAARRPAGADFQGPAGSAARARARAAGRCARTRR